MTKTLDADLVFEGGGVKGIGLVGAYSVLQENDYAFHRIAGTSAGAIVGALVAAGMPAPDLQALMREIDYRKFEDEGLIDRFGPVGKGLSLILEKGIYEGDYLRTWLQGVLEDLGVRTFADLRIADPEGSLPPERSYKLVVMASDVTRGRLVRLPWDYPLYGLDPDEQLVADAVRASMSIPFFFEPITLHAIENGKKTACTMVDGGMLSNYPIDVFDRTDGKKPRWPTFGVKLSARPMSILGQKFETDTTIEFVKALIGTMTNFHDQMHVEDLSVIARTMFVDTLSVRATDFDIDSETQDKLYANGRDAATKFLTSWNFERYVRKFRTRARVRLTEKVPTG